MKPSLLDVKIAIMAVLKRSPKKVKLLPMMLPGFEPEVKPLLLEKVVVPEEKNRSGAPSSLGNLLKNYQPKKVNKYVSREFQDYGYRLAMELDDPSHASMYIRLAQKEDRGLLESARSFVIDSKARSKGRLFMWKLKQLKDEVKEKETREEVAGQQVSKSAGKKSTKD